MIEKRQKEWIDKTSYEGLLRRWRFAPSADSIFQGETGKYFEEVMHKKKLEIGDAAAVQASKNIGWNR